MNPTIKKALEHLENANYAGYFAEMDKVEIPKHLKTTYAERKAVFVASAAPFNFHQILTVFAMQVLEELEKINAKLDDMKEEKNEDNPCHIPNITQLTGSQIKLLIAALSSAFPSITELARFVRLELDKNLNTITGSSNITDAAFDLITYFESEGKLRDLICKAYKAKPENPKIKEFVKSL